MDKKITSKSLLIVIAAIIAALIGTVLAVFAFGSFTTLADGEKVEDEPTLIATVNLGADTNRDRGESEFDRESFSEGWIKAIDEYNKYSDKADATAYVKVVLLKDWTPTSANVGFGSSAAGFDAGRILVPAGTNIKIDLSGHNIDRQLIEGKENGQVLLVKGKLTVDDSKEGGKITGGYNETTSAIYGGCVRVDGGVFNFKGGAITGNRSSSDTERGIGVCVVNGGVFNMYNGAVVSNNTPLNDAQNVFGGGISIDVKGRINIYGGEVFGNEAFNGGGICSYTETAVSNINNDDIHITITGGAIHDNKAVRYNTTDVKSIGDGGGICVYGRGNLTIAGDSEIYNNFSRRRGGGIYVYANKKAQSKVYIGGNAHIHHNVTAYIKPGPTFNTGGGMDLTTSTYNKDASGNIIQALLTTIEGNAIIEHNYSICNSWDMDVVPAGGKAGSDCAYTYGGGIMNRQGGLTVNGGTIRYNRTLSVIDDPYLTGDYTYSDEDLAELLKELMEVDGKYDKNPNLVREVVRNENGDSKYDSNGKTTWIDGDTTPIADGYCSWGGGIYSLMPTNNVTNGFLTLNGGKIYGNRATSGGAVCLEKSHMSLNNDVEIHDNYALHGGGTYIQAGGTVSASGEPKMYGNYNITNPQKAVESNLEIVTKERALEITGTLNDNANIHTYVTVNMIADGTAITKNYGKYNRKYVSVTGDDSSVAPDGYDNKKDGIVVYANPYRYLASDEATAIANGSTRADNPDNPYVAYQYFVVNDEGEVGVSDAFVVFEVKYSNGKTKIFEYGNKDNVTEENNWNYVATTYGDDVYPVSVTSKVYARKPDIEERDFYKQPGIYSPEGLTAEQYTPEGWKEPIWCYLVRSDELKIANEEGVQPAAGVYTTSIRFNPEEFEYTVTPQGSTKTNTVHKYKSKNDIAPMTASFHVVVKAKPLTTADVDISLTNEDGSEFTGGIYNGEDKLPDVCTVKLGEITLVKDQDYTLSYHNYVNPGYDTAYAKITFINNYVGEAQKKYTILPIDDPNIKTHVTWQVYSKSEKTWININDDNRDDFDKMFTYDGTDRFDQIRAVLTVPLDKDITPQTVYAYDYTVDEEEEGKEQNTSMYFEYLLDGEDAKGFVNAGTYTLKIVGYAIYAIVKGGDELNNVVMNRQPYDVSDSDYSAYIDGQNNKLWRLKIDFADNTVITDLLDSAVYTDPKASENEYGDKVTTATNMPGKFARYRGVPLSVVLNYDYVLSDLGITIRELLDTLGVTEDDITITPAEGVVGKNNDVTDVTTRVTIKINNNYFVNESNTLNFVWNWKIVTIANGLLTASGKEIVSNQLGGWQFGDWNNVLGYAFRPEHGDTVFYSYYNVNADGSVDTSKTVGEPFAVVYSSDMSDASRKFYGTKVGEDGKLAVDTSKPIKDESYLFNYNYKLKAGRYQLQITIPQVDPYTEAHHHWWDGDVEANDYGTMYYELTYKFVLDVTEYVFVDEQGEIDSNIEFIFPENNFVYYTGKSDNIVHPVIKLFDKVLEEGIDYILLSATVNAGEAELTIKGINSLNGVFTIKGAYKILQAQNVWVKVPSIMQWTYTGFSTVVNQIIAQPQFLEEEDGMWFAIARDKEGKDIITGLGHIDVTDGSVSDEVAELLNLLSVGDYYLCAYVNATDNYSEIVTAPIPFHVFAATNSWVDTPSVKSWTEGKFTKVESVVTANPMFGTAHIKITSTNGKTVYYSSDSNVNKLAGLKPGKYRLTAWVDEDIAGNYNGLYEYIFDFQVFEKPGLPWWAVLLIVIGALGIAALIIFILWKKGVFQILTEKITVAIRTKASIDATIAAVRAAKREDEARKSVAAAEAKERAEARRAAAKAEREKPAEERAAAMEAKAKAQAERAEKMRLRAEAMQARAARMREQGDKKSEQVTDAPQTQQEAAATEQPATED